MIKSEANNIPPPQRCTITRVYDDKTHCDIKTAIGELKYIDVIGSDITIGSNAVILYFDENYEDYVVIADSDLEDIYDELENLDTRLDNVEQTITTKIKSKISYGQVDSTSTSTVFTATVEGITSLEDGTAVMLRNGIVTSATGWTLNVNGLGAKPVYSNMADATRETTTFNINYTILFIYDANRIEGGCWIYYRGYYSDANSIAYQVRTNSSKFKALDKGYRYRLWLEVSDGEFMPVNVSTSTNATANRSQYMNNREFLINGRILYNSYNGTTDANALLSTGTMWQQYTFAAGYSFNNTNAALNLTIDAPLYMVAKPTNNGKARLHSPFYTQSLPNSEDGLIYIYLGQMYSATNLELTYEHRTYEYKNGAIRQYERYDMEDYMTWEDYTNDLGNQTSDGEFLRGLDNLIQAITGRGDL